MRPQYILASAWAQASTSARILARSREHGVDIARDVFTDDFRVGALAEISKRPQQEVRLVHAGKAKFGAEDAILK